MVFAGTNFGPSSNPLVQYVRVTSSVAEYATLNFTVLSDTAMNVTVGPGVGKGLALSMRVADQDSPVSQATFDYLSPVVLGLLPPTGPTTSINGFPVVVVGRNFGLSSRASVAVQIGNTEDGTLSAWLPAQPVFPPGDNGMPRVRATETISFQLPPGAACVLCLCVLGYFSKLHR